MLPTLFKVFRLPLLLLQIYTFYNSPPNFLRQKFTFYQKKHIFFAKRTRFSSFLTLIDSIRPIVQVPLAPSPIRARLISPIRIKNLIIQQYPYPLPPPSQGHKKRSPRGLFLRDSITTPVVERRRPPTLPHCIAVPSAQAGLTSLFGMGRGGTPPQ